MRRRLLALVLLAPSTALADTVETGEASADVEADVVVHGDLAYATARVVGAAERDQAWDFYHLTVTAAAQAEARGGTDTPLAAHLEGRAFLGDVDAPGVATAGLMVTTVAVEADAEVLPALDARRDVHRAAYSRAAASLLVVGLRGSTGRVRWEGIEIGLGGAVSAQLDGAGRTVHREQTMHGVFGRRCRLRARPAPDACVAFLPFDALGVTGGSEAAVGTFYPATWSGIGLGGGLYADVGVGFGGTGTMTTEESGQVVDTIATEDLPNVGAAVGFVGVRGRRGDVTVAARASRDFYLTIDGDLGLDDRVRVDVGWDRGATRYRANAFAARTRWWTSKADPGHHGTTGGGELGVGRALRLVDVDASVAVARSFYGVLDGAAADRAGVAGTATVTLRRNVKTVTW